MLGVVDRYSPKDGYGFIKADSDGTYFLHFSAIKDVRIPAVGDRVEFEVGLTSRGPSALNVRII